ncbi:MAG TPA: ATP-dependent 6-phosphofructokinase [Burkholderiaceae bacterium]|nr:ATP-dependent 6-phosphofructokinase [Burkholderiaceae bacterium]
MDAKRPRRIGLLTGGGDCPGLNAVIRAVTRTARSTFGATVIGIEDGFEGLLGGRIRELDYGEVAGLIGEGGTVLGTTNKGDPWHFPVPGPDGTLEIADVSDRMLERIRELALDTLVVVGGDGSMHIAERFARRGVAVVGVPKTIDNDLAATDTTFGFDTAVSIVSEAIDRLTTTASSHHRVMVIEVMGRYAGWIALAGGMAGGADTILIPEIPFRWDSVFRHVRHRAMRGRRFSIVCVAEGAKLPEGGEVLKGMDRRRTDARQLGGIGAVVARRIEEGTGLETRVTVLGHLQRGGSPTAYDRILATRFGVAAAEAACRGESGVMVGLRGTEIVTAPIADAISSLRTVPPDHPWVSAARAVGTRFGDEVEGGAEREGEGGGAP